MLNIVDDSLSTIGVGADRLNHSSQVITLNNQKPPQIRKSASISRLHQNNNRVVNIVTPGGLVPKKK